MLKNVDVHEVGKGGFKVCIITVSSLVEVKEIYDPSPSPPQAIFNACYINPQLSRSTGLRLKLVHICHHKKIRLSLTVLCASIYLNACFFFLSPWHGGT